MFIASKYCLLKQFRTAKKDHGNANEQAVCSNKKTKSLPFIIKLEKEEKEQALLLYHSSIKVREEKSLPLFLSTTTTSTLSDRFWPTLEPSNTFDSFRALLLSFVLLLVMKRGAFR